MTSPAPKPPVTEPLSRSDGTPTPAWTKYFDSATRQMGGLRAVSEYGSWLQVAHNKPVPGYLPADGRSLPVKDYPGLFEKIGYDYGTGDGGALFFIPNVEPAGAFWWHIRADQP